MKTLYRFLFFSCLLFNVCDHGTSDYIDQFLTDEDKNFLPYSVGQSIKFVHSNGFSFYLDVTGSIFDTLSSMNDCAENYSYEIKKVTLKSSIPDFFITITQSSIDCIPELTIRFNRHDFSLSKKRAPDYDSLSINNRTYFNVYQIRNSFPDSSTIVPQHILFNQFNGIIQIRMTNDETYTINN